ncbi:MAG: hypothetical protein LBK06_04055, partial [Planctomycetaceae bacterium]|nr:hypothetical protein [Planctomycetaceae bacterium]
MSTIFVRKLCVVVGVFFCGILLALPVCSQASENNCTKITEQLKDNNKKHFDSQSDLRQQLLERSKKYLLSIENNQSFSPELKKRLVLQS